MRRPAAACALALAASCQGAGAADQPYVIRLAQPAPETIEGLRLDPLFATPTLSAALASTKISLPAHYHERHEETVLIIAGTGAMWIDGQRYAVEPGMLIHVPRGAVHRVEPDGPISALSIFTPPFDGEDRIFVEE
ncbi:MAG: cupin domain-containing protein [Planctomycetota bacterium]